MVCNMCSEPTILNTCARCQMVLNEVPMPIETGCEYSCTCPKTEVCPLDAWWGRFLEVRNTLTGSKI